MYVEDGTEDGAEKILEKQGIEKKGNQIVSIEVLPPPVVEEDKEKEGNEEEGEEKGGEKRKADLEEEEEEEDVQKLLAEKKRKLLEKLNSSWIQTERRREKSVREIFSSSNIAP